MTAVPMSTIAPTTNPAAPAHPPLRIFYADDLRDLREVLRIALTREGHAIECAPDGRAAWERLAVDHATFDLVITDHHMPEMNGLELVKRLRTLPYQGRIIVFSSELSPIVTNAYHALKVDLVLPKPVFPSVLRRVLAEMFGRVASVR